MKLPAISEVSGMKETLIDPRAIVAKGAELDEGVRVGPFAVIGPKVRIGADTAIHSHAVIDGKTTMGRNNRVFNGAVLGTIPQDLKYDGEDTELVIGEADESIPIAIVRGFKYNPKDNVEVSLLHRPSKIDLFV